ncbi:DUF3592 domain-containing protein [Micromonospora sp. C28SCA-DRY-2]|uniref:DUF3592 domain-containing protein n=1 Tax=Micromonospora sp. C28SCA-DRY-2 TaxID=3059522 RepID=UPI00267697E6|nr:DUF3592 domain-containing protein [Micromonospora sp. C28SCA-DRY-2]MDO3702358.1 DUF3592 domain-containing protein [Micromonospora sp. C28SCA-DRY-2]
MPTLVLTIMTVLGLSGVTCAVVRFQRDLDLLRRGVRVPGQVVELRPVTFGFGPRTYHPVVRFRTANGREVTATPGRWRQTPLSAAPGPVTVVHEPARPTRILVEAPGVGGTSSVVVPFVTLLGVSVIVLVVGVAVFLRLS